MFGAPEMRIIKRDYINKFKSFQSSVIGKNFIKIASTVHQLKSNCDKYL